MVTKTIEKKKQEYGVVSGDFLEGTMHFNIKMMLIKLLYIIRVYCIQRPDVYSNCLKTPHIAFIMSKNSPNEKLGMLSMVI